MSVKAFPKRNDLVVATVKVIEDHGVIVSLDEFEGMEAYIPRSHVAPGRIKDIRDFVKEGDKVVGRVIRADKRLGQVDLSLRYVSESEKKEKLDEWKERNRVLSLLRLAAQRASHPDPEAVARDALEKLFEYYRNPLDALEDAISDPSLLIKAGLDEKLAEELRSIAESQLKPPIYVKNLVVKLVSFASDGVERVRGILLKGLEAAKGEAEIEIYSAGAPKYVVSVRSRDPKAVKRASANVIRAMERELGATENLEVVEERDYRRRTS